MIASSKQIQDHPHANHNCWYIPKKDRQLTVLVPVHYGKALCAAGCEQGQYVTVTIKYTFLDYLEARFDRIESANRLAAVGPVR